MRHYVLIKFKEGCFTENLFKYAKDVYKKIGNLEYIEDVHVHSNCVERDSNMDLMVEFKLKDEEALKKYLECDLHENFGKAVSGHILTKVSFDCE